MITAVGYVSQAYCIVLLYSVGNKITATTTTTTNVIYDKKGATIIRTYIACIFDTCLPN